jgi:hypothetical protein
MKLDKSNLYKPILKALLLLTLTKLARNYCSKSLKTKFSNRVNFVLFCSSFDVQFRDPRTPSWRRGTLFRTRPSMFPGPEKLDQEVFRWWNDLSGMRTVTHGEVFHVGALVKWLIEGQT